MRNRIRLFLREDEILNALKEASKLRHLRPKKSAEFANYDDYIKHVKDIARQRFDIYDLIDSVLNEE